jgi:hypothetical protein
MAAIATTATLETNARSGPAGVDTSSAPINRGSIAAKGETDYRVRTAVGPEIDLSTNVDREPSVLSDMGQVERTVSAPPMSASELQSKAFLDIAAPDAALQGPSDLAGVAAIVVSHEDLALDRVMGQTSAFALDSADALQVVAQDEANTQDGTTATVRPPAKTQAAVASKAPATEGDRGVLSRWRQQAVTGATVMLFAAEQMLFSKRRKEDNDNQRSRKSV